MKKHCLTLVLPLLMLCFGEAAGDTARLDLLLGIGDFAKSTYTMRAGGDQFGEPSRPNDTVANGWRREVRAGLSEENFMCNLSEAPGYQYLALRHISSGEGSIALTTGVAVDDSDPYRPHSGDTMTLVVDRIRMRDWADVPYVSLSMTVFSVGSTRVTKQLPYAPADYSESISMQVPSGAAQIVVMLQFYTNGNLASHEPAVFLSGAHLYLKRAGKAAYETEELPAIRTRSIATQTIGWQQSSRGVRPTAADYDEIALHAWDYPYFAALRKLNPSVRLYLYQGGTTAADTPRDARWSYCPLRLSDARVSHRDWLHPAASQNPGKDGYLYIAPYEDRFALHIASAAYQEYWATTVLEKARRLSLDGVWIDDCSALTVDHQGVRREPYEVQQFLHYVVPKLRSEGLTSIVNLSESNLGGSLAWNGDPPLAYFDPSWKPTGRFPASAGYSANTPENTPDVFFREDSFIYHGYRPNSSYWLACLDDAEVVARWNSSLPANRRKRIHCWVSQSDTGEHPAHGADGWINFALASYLLCQNDYTSLGIDVQDKPHAVVDYSITAKLGVPDGEDRACDDDPYFRYRRYKATDDGGLGGVVVVNGNTGLPRSYTVSFSALDESGNIIAPDTKILLKPNTGRIFLEHQPVEERTFLPGAKATGWPNISCFRSVTEAPVDAGRGRLWASVRGRWRPPAGIGTAAPY